MPVKKFVTVFDPSTLRPACEDFEFTNEQDMIEKITELESRSYLRFQTYEVQHAEIDGETLVGEPRNKSTYHYAKLENNRVYAPAGVVAEIATTTAENPDAPFMGDVVMSDEERLAMEQRVKQAHINEYANKDQNARFIKVSGEHDYPEFIELQEDTIVLNGIGQKLHPMDQMPPQPVARPQTPGF